MEPLAPSDPRTAGEFRLSARLGHGGMGQVFLGYSPAGRTVAVKMCHPELAADPTFVERFAREATAAQAVNGLYTAQVVAAGPYDKPPWMATAYVPGPSLTDYVYGYGPLPEVAAWRLAGGLAEALLAVHAVGLVHRDLKPSNVLLAVDGPRVIDFGISSALEVTGLTTEGSVMGSPPYMSPEQAMGEPSGPPSDVFSLGSTVAFAAGGAPPFGDGDGPSVLFRLVHTAPQLDRLPPGLRDLVAACLSKHPASRPTLPQLLRACQDATAGYAGSAGSFWPSQVTSVIVAHQSGPVSPPPLSDPGTLGSLGSLGGPHPQTVASAGVSAWLVPGDQSSGQPATPAASGIGRRRLLFGAGGLVVAAGLAVAGYELTSSGKAKPVAKTTSSRLAWTHQADGPLRTAPAISEDGSTVCIGSVKGTLYALNTQTGSQTNQYSVGGAVSGISLSGNTLLAGGADGKVRAFSIGDRGRSWTSDAFGPISGAPTWYQSTVYAGSEDHNIYALSIADGKRRWQAKTGGTTWVSSPPGTGEFQAVSQDGNIYEISTDTGKIVGKTTFQGTISTSPLLAVYDTYFGTREGGLYDVQSGLDDAVTFGTTFTADGPITGRPAVTASGEEVFVATTRGTVYMLGGGGSGGQYNPLWKFTVGGGVPGGLAVTNGVAYVGCDDGNLWAIDTSGPKLLWKYPAGAAITSGVVAVTATNLVYFGTEDNRVLAVRTN